MKFSIYILITSILILSSGCYEDYNNPIGDPEVINESPEVFIDTEITGKVNRADGTVVNNYSLEINGISYPQTLPYFIQSLKDVKKKGQLIRVLEEEKLIALANVPLIENDINSVRLSSLTETKNTSATTAYEIDYSNFLINGTLDDNTASIEVYSAIIESSIGVQSGLDNAKKHLILSPNVGLHLSFYSSTGDLIDLSSNVRLEIKDSNIIGLSLFQLNDEGKWQLIVEDIDANIVDLNSAGTYLFANYEEGVFLEGNVQKEAEAIAYQGFSLSSTDFRTTISSTVNGAFISVVPANNEINISSQSPCQKEVSNDLIQTLNVDVKDVLVNITTNNDHHKLVTQIFDCQGEITEVPAVKIINNLSGETLYLFGESQINNWIPICEGDFSIAAYDVETQSEGPAIPWSSTIIDDIDYLSECVDWVDGYSYIEINGQGKIFPPFSVVVEDGETKLLSPDDKVRLRIKGDMEGSFNVEDINVYINDDSLGSGYFISCENSALGCGLDDFEMTHLDTEGGWVRASFSGTMWMQKLNPIRAGNYSVNGQILIKVD